MKKFLAALLVVAMIFALAACGGAKPAEQPAPAEAPAEAPVEEAAGPLADEEYAAWVAHGQYLLADGTPNAWGGKDTALYEASSLKAISLDDVKAIDEGLYNTLAGKDIKYLYTIDLIFGTNDAGWSGRFAKDGKLYNANGSYAFKIAKCTSEKDGDNVVYGEDVWISDPKVSFVEALTPDTVFYPTWQEEKDENGFSWADNPLVIGGSGLYTLVIAQYKNVSSAGNPGYGVGLILKEEKEGIPYEEILEWIAADHTYGIIGAFAGSEWATDVAMEADGENVWKGEVELKAGDEFKVRADGAWDNSWGSDGYNGANLICEADGTYVVTITFGDGTDAVVEAAAK
ncbi:MAG: hypothetical protein IKD61_05435 [Oscillospiraceae bacterium]|nr:hypothetical protein [Oscillospiraceae bacterium]